MIIVMNAGAKQPDIDRVIAKVTERGLKVHLSEGRFVTIIGVVGDKKLLQDVPLEETLVCVKVGDYVAVVTAVSYTQDSSADILAAFRGL